MGSIYVRSAEDLPYGPGNPDYEYDDLVAEKLLQGDSMAKPAVVQQPAPIPAPVDSGGLMAIINRAATDPQFDVAKLESLLAVKERWEANEARKAFVVALAAFKANPPSLSKNKHVKFETAKGVTEYDHATLDHVSSTIGAALAQHGLSHRWDVEQLDGGAVRVTCVLTHVLGHSERVPMQSGRDESGGKNNIQALGSTVTYLQRYTLLAATGMAVKGPDDDGRGSEGAGKQLPDGVVADHLAAIDAAADEAELKKCFGSAYKLANDAGDNGALRLFTEHKDARKKAMGKKS